MRVLLVDDDKLVSLSLKTILEAEKEIDVVGTGYSGQQAINLYRETQPDILLLDIRMEDMTGIEAATVILKEFPQAAIVFLTTFLDNEYISQSLKIGVKGYILKQNFESIIPSLHAVQTGQSVFGDQIVSLIPELMSVSSSSSDLTACLTERELSILVEIADGLSNKEIAEKLFLSEGTVRNYVSTMLDKLELRDRTQLAIYYYKNRA